LQAQVYLVGNYCALGNIYCYLQWCHLVSETGINAQFQYLFVSVTYIDYHDYSMFT